MKSKGLLLTSVFILIGLSSCLRRPIENPVENLPPETYCFIAHVDTVDTVPAKVELFWLGNDPDGEVVGYYYAIDGKDTTFTRSTSGVFTFKVEAGDTYALHLFEVWAVDNEGATDPTPARVIIPVRNTPPVAYFIPEKLPPDTTLTVATFYFGASDIDGDHTITGFLYRLDVEPETVWHYVPIDSACVFLVNIPSGDRTIYLKAIDESYAVSEAVSHSWFVKPVRGRVLLIDDSNVSQADGFYINFLETFFPDDYTVYSVEKGLPYSFLDLNYMINNLGFSLVIWYTADQSEHFSSTLNIFTTYLESGKKLVLISPAVLDVLMNPAFTPSPFVRDYMGVDSVTAWNKMLIRNEKLYPVLSDYDTLSCNLPIISRFDGFKPADFAKALYNLPTIPARWQGNPTCIVVAPSQSPKVAFISIQYHALDGLSNAGRILLKIIRDELRFK
ncbi:MAG: hypothetical protein ABIM30_10275 [candidate division WOR-3 bacterium]